jgi:hypothetical protein
MNQPANRSLSRVLGGPVFLALCGLLVPKFSLAAPIRMAVLGDSISAGSGVSGGSPNWVAQLIPTGAITFQNKAVGGATSSTVVSGQLASVVTLAQNHQIDDSTLIIGGTSRRRWYQFGLGTMFVVVTLLAVFIAYHVNWIRQRRAVIEECVYVSASAPYDPRVLGQQKHLPVRAPSILPYFGESGFYTLSLEFPGTSDKDMPVTVPAELERIRMLFPEAVRVDAFPDHPPPYVPSWVPGDK